MTKYALGSVRVGVAGRLFASNFLPAERAAIDRLKRTGRGGVDGRGIRCKWSFMMRHSIEESATIASRRPVRFCSRERD